MKISEVMTINPVTVDAADSVMKAAETMRRNDIGDVIVSKNGRLCGIVTDRDIVVRSVGAGQDPQKTAIETICSSEIVTVSPDQDANDAVTLMRSRAIRRLPVVQDGALLGIVSLGDLAVAMDRKSALGNISAAPANH